GIGAVGGRDAVVGRPFHSEIVATGNAGSVDDRTANFFREFLGEEGNAVGALDFQVIPPMINERAVVLHGAELGAVFCNDERVSRQVARFSVSDEFKSAGEQCLDHCFLLASAGIGGEAVKLPVNGGIGLRVDVEHGGR